MYALILQKRENSILWRFMLKVIVDMQLNKEIC